MLLARTHGAPKYVLMVATNGIRRHLPLHAVVTEDREIEEEDDEGPTPEVDDPAR